VRAKEKGRQNGEGRNRERQRRDDSKGVHEEQGIVQQYKRYVGMKEA
jgi:hypothetical protein